MKVHNILMVLLLVGIAVGCSNYLDVQPKDKQSEEQLFATSGGFYTATNGVYNMLASSYLYGGNLSYGLVDIISKRYLPVTSNTYFTALATFDYGNSDVETQLSNTWTEAYETILNCNVIIENVDKSNGILTEQEAAMIKGEMLAVRACLHFDMLRLFGPIYAKDHTAESIPYNESSQVAMLPFLSADTVLHYKILRDLQEAESLLEGNDPVIENGPMASTVENEDVNLRYRQLRFNYYAVLGLMARVYLYAEDYTNALAYATKLLNDPQVHEHFPAVDPTTLLANQTNPDRVFSTEVLAGIYKDDRDEIYTSYFDPNQSGSNLLQPRSSFVDGNLFAGMTQDYRYQTHWEVASGVGVSGYAFIKYRGIDGYVTEENPDEETPYFYALLMSLVRLSEMYYIAAESEPDLADKYTWLDNARVRRGVTVSLPVVSEDDFYEQLRLEYLREFWGEGQIFFMYKRMNSNIMSTENGYNTSSFAASDARYVLPMPSGEIENR